MKEAGDTLFLCLLHCVAKALSLKGTGKTGHCKICNAGHGTEPTLGNEEVWKMLENDKQYRQVLHLLFGGEDLFVKHNHET